jgi:cation transport regulator ChaC
MRCVIVVGQRRACRHRLIHGIGRGVFKHAQQDRGVSHRPGQRACRVLISGNRNLESGEFCA